MHNPNRKANTDVVVHAVEAAAQCNALTGKRIRAPIPSRVNAVVSAHKSCHIKYFGICFRLWDINLVIFFFSFFLVYARKYSFFIFFIIENRFLYDYLCSIFYVRTYIMVKVVWDVCFYPRQNIYITHDVYVVHKTSMYPRRLCT